MIHFPSPLSSDKFHKMNARPLPQRNESIRPGAESALLSLLPDELHDIRRVQDYGQEEDLKDALGKMISRVEELVSADLTFSF